jgi:16S rRNA (guanine966-N2)-methyltransferase
MRVISGVARGRKLQSVPGDQTRPITDRVKEALFDIIGGDVVDSTWWDVFAGTGAVAIEALSRGARHALLTDLHRAPLETIRTNLSRTGLASAAQVRRADSLLLLRSRPETPYDYVFVAPPQYKDLWQQSLHALDASSGWLATDGWIIVQIDPSEYRRLPLTEFVEFDQRRYGTTLLVFFRRPQ